MCKFLGFLIVTAISAVVAFWPEAAMYGVYHAVSPVTELGRIVLALGLLFVGGGISILFGFLGLAMWAHGVGEVLK